MTGLGPGCGPGSGRLGQFEVVQRRADPGALDRHPGQGQAHLDAAQGARQFQVAQVAQVPDAEHAPSQLAQARAEGGVEAVQDDLKQASVIMASFVDLAAMRDAMLPRKPLPKPRS